MSARVMELPRDPRPLSEQFAKAHGYDPKELTVYDTLKMPAYKIRRERKRQARADALRRAYEERRRAS